MSDSVLTYLDSYCERAGHAGMLAEPLNFFTNAFFILAAILSARALRQANITGKRTDLWLLVIFMFSIGIGSGLWHGFPSGATVLMDVIPITLFINAYIISALRRLFGFDWTKTISLWGNYFLLGIIAQFTLPADLLNGTIMYIPTYFALVVMTLTLLIRDRALGEVFAKALLVWTASLIFRTIDREICPSMGLGTHFLWHTLNAWVLWRLLMAMIAKAK